MSSQLIGICRTGHRGRAIPTASILFLFLLTTAASTAEDRTTLAVSVNGAQIPSATQPRVVVDQQRGAVDQTRIKVTGMVGVEYARTIALGDPVEITARTDERAAITVFSGEVVSLQPGFDQAQPFVVIHAANTLIRTDDAAARSATISHDGSGADARLVAFLAAISSTSSLQEVVVIGVDALTGDPLVGRAMAPTIRLDQDGSERIGTTITVNVEERFFSVDEANAYALRILTERALSRLPSEVLTEGIADIRVGALVVLTGTGTRFDGAYVVAAVQHRIGPDSNDGYSTVIRVGRHDLGMFFIPEVDDEVLVAFEHGDPSKPLVLGSWWGCDSSPEPERSDEYVHCRLLRWPW